jgi:hypothetical protein
MKNMSHVRSAFSGVSVPVGSDNSAHQITNNNNIQITNVKKEGVEEVSDGIYVVYPNTPEKTEKERDIQSATDRLNELKAQVPEDKSLIEALSLIVDLLYDNPLYNNKYVICQQAVLSKLIQLLTKAYEVQITVSDPTCDCGCLGSSNVVISSIDSIYIRESETSDVLTEFRYYYANAKVFLETNHISTKFVQVSTS